MGDVLWIGKTSKLREPPKALPPTHLSKDWMGTLVNSRERNNGVLPLRQNVCMRSDVSGEDLIPHLQMTGPGQSLYSLDNPDRNAHHLCLPARIQRYAQMSKRWEIRSPTPDLHTEGTTRLGVWTGEGSSTRWRSVSLKGKRSSIAQIPTVTRVRVHLIIRTNTSDV
jgi:hypothetical protein